VTIHSLEIRVTRVALTYRKGVIGVTIVNSNGVIGVT